MPPRHLRDYVLDSQAAESVILETSDHNHDQSYFPVIDGLLSELKRRFSSESSHILKGATALNPKHKTLMDKDCLIVSMARHYGITDEDLSHDLLELLKPYQETYVDLLQTRVHLYHKKWRYANQQPRSALSQFHSDERIGS